MKYLYMYIHIPFCKSKCAYCDFLSFAKRDDFFEPYVKALLKQISSESHKYKDYIIKTIFIGGGTPSLISSSYICEIVETVFKLYNVDGKPEITIEANPESSDIQKLEDYKNCGINRISFGVQSFDNGILKRIGRVHSIEKFFESYNNARNTGFGNINFDIMFGLPEQTPEGFEQTVKSAVALQPQHISCYGLILEDNTPLFMEKNEKGLLLAGEDEEFLMYSFAKRYLEENGYIQYEISNYAKPGFESRHNLAYWSNKEYAGFGLGAHSSVSGDIRFHNTEVLEDYINGDFSRKDFQRLDVSDKYAEYMFLGLRKTTGVSQEDFLSTFGVCVYDIYGGSIEKHLETGLLKAMNGRIFLSEKGVYLSNIVFCDFLPG